MFDFPWPSMLCCFEFQDDTRQTEISRERHARAFVPFALATLLTLASREWWQVDNHTVMPPLTPGVLISSLLFFFIIFYCPTPAWIWRVIPPSTSSSSPQRAEALPGTAAAWTYLTCMILASLLVAISLRTHVPTSGLPLGVSTWVVLGAMRLGVRCRGDAEMLQASSVRVIMVRVRRSGVNVYALGHTLQLTD